MHVDAAHNTPDARPAGISQELEDRIMAALPRPLADWLRYDATGDTCPKVVFQEWRAGRTVDQILAGLKSLRRHDTWRTYGGMHPGTRLS